MAADCDTVLAAMAGRSGWHADALSAETGLSVSKTASALMLLQHAGRVREDVLVLLQEDTAGEAPASRGWASSGLTLEQYIVNGP